MTEEEKKVIERVKEDFMMNGLGCKYYECTGDDMKVVLELIDKLIKERDDIYADYQDLEEERHHQVEKLERQIKIKDSYCELLCDIAVDYDGFYTVSGLKDLVDELVGLAKKAIENDDKSVAYWSLEDGKEYNLNILEERIGEREGKK